jgi:hypothetical protein
MGTGSQKYVRQAKSRGVDCGERGHTMWLPLGQISHPNDQTHASRRVPERLMPSPNFRLAGKMG